MTKVYTEAFNTDSGSDLALSTHVASSGQTPSFSQRILGASGAALFTASGTARSTVNTAALYACNVTPGTASYQVQADLVIESLIAGVGFSPAGRLPTSGANADGYRVQLQQTDGVGGAQVRIQKTDTTGTSAAATTLATGPGFTVAAAQTHTVILDLSTTGQQVAFLDGAARCVSFDTAISRTGRAGLFGATIVQSTAAIGIQPDNLYVEDMTNVPVFTVIPAMSGTFNVGQTVSVDNGTATNTPTSYAYQWMRAGTAIVGATSSTYLLVSADNGNAVTCAVKAVNASGFAGAAATPQNVSPAPNPPVNTQAPAIAWQTGTDPQAVGSVVVITAGRESNTPTTQDVKLQRSTDGGATWPTLLAESNAAYPVANFNYTTVSADASSMLRATETATNADGSSAPAVSNVLNVSALALTTANLHWRLSGGSANSDPLAAIGGVMSSVAAGASLFDRVPGSIALVGQVDYRCVYLFNDHPTAAGAALAYILSQFTAPGVTLAVGVATEAAGNTVGAIADRFTAPAGVTFLSPTALLSALDMGTIPGLSRRGLWLRRTVAAGTAAATSNPWAVRGDVTPL